MAVGWSDWHPLGLAQEVPAATLAEQLDGGQAFRWRLLGEAGVWQGVFGATVAAVRVGAAGLEGRVRGPAAVGLAALRAYLDNDQAVAIPIFESPGANAIDISDQVRAKMTELSRRFPPGMTWKVAYDPTIFVRDSIKSVITTLGEAIFLVVLVVILFLQTWRASIIPLIAVPVSVVGTFAVLLALGFSINTLTLFGLVLAIGIVVDDAIVVVENVERKFEHGETDPVKATAAAMREVAGPIVATTLSLAAVFTLSQLMNTLPNAIANGWDVFTAS